MYGVGTTMREMRESGGGGCNFISLVIQRPSLVTSGGFSCDGVKCGTGAKKAVGCVLRSAFCCSAAACASSRAAI